MKTQPFSQPTVAARTNQRRWLWLGLGIIMIVAALAVYFSAVPRSEQPQPALRPAVAVDPAAQGVNGYLRAHASVGQVVAIDPATQSVSDYLRAHAYLNLGLVAPALAVDPAAQSVSNYLRAHRVEPTARRDPATQSVMDYLRAHDSVQFTSR